MAPHVRSDFPMLLFCAVAAPLYAIGLVSRAVGFDEAITIQSLAERRLGSPEPGFVEIASLGPFVEGVTTLPEVILRYVETDVHPPLYFALAHGVTLVLGNELVIVRGLSLLLVVASVFLYGRTLQRIDEPGLGICLGVYGVSFAAATTAQDARGYALALLLAIAAWRVLALQGTAGSAANGRTHLGSEILLGLLSAGLLLTHYFALFVVAPLLGWRMLEAARNRDPAGLVAPLVCGIAFLPWLPVMLSHLGARPDQMTGFQGTVEWIKRMAQLTAGQIFTPTHGAVPDPVRLAGRCLVVLLATVGSLDALARGGQSGPRRRFGLIAVWVVGTGLVCFLVVSIVLDRWFDQPRYFLFFAPFIAYLAGRGAIVSGHGLARLTGYGRMVLLPGLILVSAEIAMLNFGWEANRSRDGSYFRSMAEQIRAAGTDKSLAIVDIGTGGGTVLSAALAFPATATAYLLDPDPMTWDAAAAEIATALPDRDTVLLVYTITRGDMESDKSLLYTPIIEMLESSGFERVAAPPVPYGGRFYAKWERVDRLG